MKKLLFGIALILFSLCVVVLDINNELPTILECVYLLFPLIGLVFCIVGLVEKEG